MLFKLLFWYLAYSWFAPNCHL